jgi:hypothetical protein
MFCVRGFKYLQLNLLITLHVYFNSKQVCIEASSFVFTDVYDHNLDPITLLLT